MKNKETVNKEIINNTENNERLLSIVVPVFNEIEVIHAFYERVKNMLDSLNSISYEIIFVGDVSTDNTYQKLFELANSDGKL
jgi:glycosyltransferase involved in cell wall biosynthesis